MPQGRTFLSVKEANQENAMTQRECKNYHLIRSRAPTEIICSLNKMLILFLLAGLLLSVAGQFVAVKNNNGFPLCAINASLGPVLPVEPEENLMLLSSDVPEPVKCGFLCSNLGESSCVAFNCIENAEPTMCHMFGNVPNEFVERPGCAFFKIKPSDAVELECSTATTTTKPTTTVLSTWPTAASTMAATCSPLPYPIIDASDCSFPFTSNGVNYYNCTSSLSEVTLRNNSCPSHLCLKANRTVAICNPPADYIAQTTSFNITLPLDVTIKIHVTSVSGWLVMQQRNSDTTFNWQLTWALYRNGFGTIGKNYWLGLELVHQLTTSASYRLRFELQQATTGKWFSSEYWSFVIGDETVNKYRINTSGYSGDGGDGLHYTGNSGYWYNDEMKFTTVDSDNDNYGGNCVSLDGGAWWYNSCYWSCVTCNTANFQWDSLPGTSNYLLMGSRMLIKLQ